VGVDKHFADDL